MDDPLTPEENEKYWARVVGRERERLRTLQDLEDHLMATLADRKLTAIYELPVTGWLSIIDEIKNRHPVGFMALLRDDAMTRLNAAIERIHEEVNYMVAVGPSPSIAARQNEQRALYGRQAASPGLQKMLKKKR